MEDTGIKIVTKNRKFYYMNTHGYILCEHKAPLIPVKTSFGNQSFICSSCGKVVKRELMGTH